MKQLIIIYAENIYEIYQLQEWLRNALAKKIRRGVKVDRTHLAECQTMRKIVREAEKYATRDTGRRATTEERRAVREEIADRILDELEF